jgi:peptidoglycan/LPS O-acetylase OafA/YrhL
MNRSLSQAGTHPIIDRLYGLDAARGIAALSVVVWHWQHFFYASTGRLPNNFITSSQPFYHLLTPFYKVGFIAVDFFFCLSGFVFFWLYQYIISRGELTCGSFFLLRFSRLYPLQLATLLFVACGQYFFHLRTATYFIYPCDFYHFIMNLFFVQNWWTSVVSFNGPSWSVSSEVLLYCIFFGLARLNILRHVTASLVLAFLGILPIWHDLPIASGLTGFYLGGCIYFLWQRLLNSNHAWRNAVIVAVLGGFAWAAFIAIVKVMQSESLSG